MTSTTNTQTHVRATKAAARRISRLGKKLASTVGGTWGQAAVVDKALDCLDRHLNTNTADAAKAQA